MTSAIFVLSTGLVAPDPVPVEIELPSETGLGRVRAFSCGDKIGVGLVSPARLRRLGRTQRLIVSAACQAVSGRTIPDEASETAGVAIGSGAGEQNETVEFLRNMIALEEAEPKPARFVNSVPSSLSAQVAMELGFRGENVTCTHHGVSFELALWHAATLLRTGRASMALAGGADALEADLLAVGVRSGWWRADAAPHVPLRDGHGRGVIAGEGAGALLLGLDAPRIGAPRLALVHTRPLVRPLRQLDAVEEADTLLGLLARHGVAVDGGTLFLSGANGSDKGDTASAAVMNELAVRLGRAPAVGVYKHRTGEFCSAPALAAVLAVRAVQTGHVPAEIELVRGEIGGGVRAVVCHSLSEPGGRGAMAFIR